MSNPAKNLARMNCGATIDLVGRDGRLVTAPGTTENSSVAALILDDDTLSYPLPQAKPLSSSPSRERPRSTASRS